MIVRIPESARDHGAGEAAGKTNCQQCKQCHDSLDYLAA
jgi:hypothetical protein